MSVLKKFFTGLQLNGNKVTGVMDGVSPSDAINRGQLDTQDTSLRAYVDSKVSGMGEFIGDLIPTAGFPTTGSGGSGEIVKDDWWKFSQNGYFYGQRVYEGDRLHAIVDDADTMEDFDIHSEYNPDHTRCEFNNLSLTAPVSEVIGAWRMALTSAMEAGDSLQIHNVVIDAGSGNADIDTDVHTDVASQATRIQQILLSDGVFAGRFDVLNDISGTVTILERTGEATGIALSYDDNGLTAGAVTYTEMNQSVKEFEGVDINHNFLYKYVQVSVADQDDEEVEVKVKFISHSIVRLIVDTPVVVSGVISI